MNKEIRYLLFLNETLEAKALKEEICDEFTRKIFDYLEEAESPFAAQVFCVFFYHFIHRCKLRKGLLMEDLSFVQKLDVLHFAICALNYLSRQYEPEQTFSMWMSYPLNPVSKPNPEDLKVISDNLNFLRESLICNNIKDRENLKDDSEFDENLPDIVRISKALEQDKQIEKQWLSRKPPVFIEPETAVNVEKKKTNQDLSPYKRKRIIEEAVRLSEKRDRWGGLDLVQELGISKSTFDRQKRSLKLKMRMIRDEANAIIREREK